MIKTDNYLDVLPLYSPENIKYRKIADAEQYISTDNFRGKQITCIAPEALELLTYTAFRDISHLLRTSHLQQISEILNDSEASDNDKFIACEILENAVIAAEMELPICQDTGTALILGKKGQEVWTTSQDKVNSNGANDASPVTDKEALSAGVERAYTSLNLRYSQVAPLSMYEEANTGNNLPAQIELSATEGNEYEFLFIAKGGGSANKTFLFQETRAIIEKQALINFLKSKITELGASACPPYHLAIVIGGTSAELNLKTVKLASARYLDNLPQSAGGKNCTFRDTELEKEILKIANSNGLGAQFGGKYFCLDVRVIRMPRHGASLPIGIGVSCIADRQAIGKITSEGIFIEELETNPASLLSKHGKILQNAIDVDLNRPMKEVLKQLSEYPTGTRLNLHGSLIVARDIAHAKIKNMLRETGDIPQYFKDYPIYYAGPAKTPEGKASGSFGPTTAGRMDSYVDEFQKLGGSMIMLAKGNRSQQVIDACRNNGGFYLGSIGGVAARLAKESIKKVETVDFPELGMEAVWKIDVENFPAFIIIDDKGNNFYKR